MMVIAHQGDIQFGAPEMMNKGEDSDPGFGGGEVDPVTGEIRVSLPGTSRLWRQTLIKCCVLDVP